MSSIQNKSLKKSSRTWWPSDILTECQLYICTPEVKNTMSINLDLLNEHGVLYLQGTFM